MCELCTYGGGYVEHENAGDIGLLGAVGKWSELGEEKPEKIVIIKEKG